MWGMVVTGTFDLLWPYPTCQHTGPRIVCNVGGRLVPHRNRREKSCVCLYSNSKHRHPDQIRSTLAAPLTLAEVSSLGRRSLDGAELEAGPGAWNSGPTVLGGVSARQLESNTETRHNTA